MIKRLNFMGKQKDKYTQLMIDINSDVYNERCSQNIKWGIQRHDWGKWLAILAEEFGEAAQAMQPLMGLTSIKETDANDLYMELIQVAAVASAIAEQIKEKQEEPF